ncbi:Unknown protein, partial [Striga hermonthica]
SNLDRIIAEMKGRAQEVDKRAPNESFRQPLPRQLLAPQQQVPLHQQHQRVERGDEDDARSVTSHPVAMTQPEGLTLETLAAQMQELQARVQGKRPVVSRGHPFAEDVLGGDLPSNFRELSLSYDGSADPARHLRSFDNIAVLHRYSDAVCCRAFLTTLKGSAQDWFHQLPAGSIDCFEKFSSMFLNQFASAKKHEKTYLSLINMQQKKGETLRQYVARYTKECVEVPSASEEVKAGGLTRGLRPGKCKDSLAKRPARSFDELLERCRKYVNMEESEADFIRNDKIKAKQPEERPRQGDRRAAPKESRDEDRFRGPRYEHYKPLNAPQQEILEMMEKRGEDKLLAQPKPLPPPRKFSASKDRYCR